MCPVDRGPEEPGQGRMGRQSKAQGQKADFRAFRRACRHIRLLAAGKHCSRGQVFTNRCVMNSSAETGQEPNLADGGRCCRPRHCRDWQRAERPSTLEELNAFRKETQSEQEAMRKGACLLHSHLTNDRFPFCSFRAIEAGTHVRTKEGAQRMRRSPNGRPG
jgi:hypothetical protein